MSYAVIAEGLTFNPPDNIYPTYASAQLAAETFAQKAAAWSDRDKAIYIVKLVSTLRPVTITRFEWEHRGEQP
jgi:hypothetical protein